MRCILLFIALLLPASHLLAQQADGTKTTLNQTDKKGRREGMWLIQQPERMGEDAYAEFGNYIAGQKFGVWYRMTPLEEIIAIEHYNRNVLDGEVQYYEQGRLVCIGHYLGLNPDQDYDTIFVTDPITQNEKMVRIATDRGTLKHGTWRYYDAATGRLAKEEEWSADELVDRKEFTISQFDSAYYQRRLKLMPHNQKHIYKPPPGKRSLTH